MRQYFLSFSELIDRLSVVMMKEVNIPEHKKEYNDEKNLILHDLDEIIKEKNVVFDKDLLHYIIVLVQLNAHIWYNLASINADSKDDYIKMKITTDLNGMRNRARNKIQELVKEENKKEYKKDCPEVNENIKF
jgi:hypothetical protein